MRGTPPNFSGQKRKEAPNITGTKASKKVKRVGPRSDTKGETANGDGERDGEGSSKPKRVRTGCLTCRERHLKCDEAMPHCNNCKKSNRTCKRGVRLNFIDTWESRPPTYVTAWGTHDWKVEFQDESREIASEYQGGEERYRQLDRREKRQSIYPPPIDSATSFEFPHHRQQPQAPPMGQILPPVQALIPDQYAEQNVHQQNMGNVFEPQPVMKQETNPYQPQPPPHSAPSQQSQYAESNASNMHARSGSIASFSNMETDLPDPESAKKEVLDTQEETFFMQVFVEEVGLWMDSMDPQKHFSRLLPFHSLSEPMLLNAFLACGARHLTLINPSYTEEKALNYYDTATRYLLKNLQNPNRDTVICATTAVILNVYEIMSERALQRMNHIAGARALIKECGWDARAQGIGSACFWLNVGLEVLSCLHFNWQVAWNPDDWSVDMDFTREIHNGREEVWTHRMLYIIAKVCNFRATAPRSPAGNTQNEQIRMQQRHEEWSRLKGMCDAWNEGVPRTMHPLAYLHPFQTPSKSAFPEVWLIKRATIVARLFYHTAMLLMAQIHPYYDVNNHPEMAAMQSTHSRTICGIVAHVKDRGVASVAIRSLHHAAECLTDRKEQEEVLQVFEKINKETGWRIGFVFKGLKEKWGWVEEPSPSQQLVQTQMTQSQQLQPRLSVQFPQQMPNLQQVQNGQRLSVQVGHAGYNAQQQQQGMQMSPHSMSGSPASQQGQPQHMSNNNAGTPTSMPSQMDSGLVNGGSFHNNQYQQQPQQQMAPPVSAPPAAAPKKGGFPVGIPNPLYAKADFNLPQHPYQNFYVAPSHTGGQQGPGQQQWYGQLYGQGQGQF